MATKTWNDFSTIEKANFVQIKGSSISFQIQDGPIKEVGVNGCQIDELGKVWLQILEKFNKAFPCRENSLTITKIEEALMWQQKRKENREKRNVEGLDKP